MVNHSNLTDVHRKIHNKSSSQIKWSPPEEGFVKINVDDARSHHSRSTAIAIIMRDNKANVLRTATKHLRNWPILLAECEAIRQAIIVAINMNIERVCTHSDSQIAVDAINGHKAVHNEIINIVEYIRQRLLRIIELNTVVRLQKLMLMP